MEFKIKSLIIFLFVFFSINIFAQKMPGEYIKPINELNVFKNFGLKTDPKSGYSESYFIDSVKTGPINIKLSIHDYLDENTQTTSKKIINKWIEMTLEKESFGKYTLRMLTDGGLLQGNPLKIQFKLREYIPFELPLDDDINKQFVKENILTAEEQKTKNPVFVKNDKLRLDGKEYNVKVYKAEINSETVEYSLLEEKDVRIFGIGYFKSKVFKMYLKSSSENNVSVFPSKVPVLDVISNVYKMNLQFIKQEEEKEKAIEEEKKIEEDLPDDDPINKLNNILKKNE